MVSHDILVHGVEMRGTERKHPVILQMHDDDFPARFLQDLASPDQKPISSTTVVNTSAQSLFQPVQRMLNLALVRLNCNTVGCPRVDPTRVQSAGLVVRRVFRRPGINGGPPIDDPSTLSAWMRSASGQFAWRSLSPDQENLDPDPTKRPQLVSGQAEVDRQLAALSLTTAYTENTTPAFAAPPTICAKLNRTVLYALIPTASSEVSDTHPMKSSQFDSTALIQSLPGMLLSGENTPAPVAPIPGGTLDCRSLSDAYLNANYAAADVPPIQVFLTALRMLHSAFNAFDGTTGGTDILNILDLHNVTFADGSIQKMGEFYKQAKTTLLDYNAYPSDSSLTSPTPLQMPMTWDWLTDGDQAALIAALLKRAQHSSKKQLAPQGRFQDSTRLYRLRVFFRIKGETPNCPAELVWSHYSKPFKIAAWFDSSVRPHPPIQLPDPTSDFLSKAKPNCSFHVPGNLMSALQGTSMSGLMNGAGGGGGLSLDWICGFNIPLITICAFFVLNIFLMLLNIVFFWLPFIKICIPFPSPSSASPDDGTP
jgi:hypothetical protein